jgi:hypothetical protein
MMSQCIENLKLENFKLTKELKDGFEKERRLTEEALSRQDIKMEEKFVTMRQELELIIY